MIFLDSCCMTNQSRTDIYHSLMNFFTEFSLVLYDCFSVYLILILNSKIFLFQLFLRLPESV